MFKDERLYSCTIEYLNLFINCDKNERLNKGYG